MSAAEQLNSKVIEQVRRRMKLWGEWVRSLEGVDIGCHIGQYDERTDRGHSFEDPEAERMEKIMCRIKAQQPPCYKVLKMIYLSGLSIRQTAEELRVSEATVKVWRSMGEASAAAYWDADHGIKK